MATVSTLAVNLIARTSAFEKGMGRSRKRLSFVQRQAMATRAAVLSMARGFVIAAGIGGMGLMIKRSFDTIDATAKMSDRLGIATEDIIAFGHAAQITGMDAAGMNKALETFVRRIGEVRLGTGQAKVALEKLGLTADELANAKHADNFQLIAEKISQMENASDKAATAYFLFGRQGQQMLNFLNMGARGLDVFRKEVDRLGLSFSRLDAAKVEMANDAMTRLRARFTGIAQTAAIQLAPAIESITTKLVEMSLSGGDSGERMVNSFRKTTKAIVIVGDVVKRTTALFKGLFGASVNFNSLWFGGNLTKKGRLLQDIATDIKAEATETLLKPFDFSRVDKWFDDVEKRAAEASTNIAKSAVARVPLAASKSQVTAGERLTALTRTPTEKFKKDIGEYNSLLKIGAITWDTYGRAVRAARKILETGFNETPLIKAGKRLTESLLTPMETFEKRLAEINKLFKAGVITQKTFDRATAKATGAFGGFPQMTDFGVLPSSQVSIKGLSIGGADSGIQSELKIQTSLLTVIAGKEGLM